MYRFYVDFMYFSASWTLRGIMKTPIDGKVGVSWNIDINFCSIWITHKNLLYFTILNKWRQFLIYLNAIDCIYLPPEEYNFQWNTRNKQCYGIVYVNANIFQKLYRRNFYYSICERGWELALYIFLYHFITLILFTSHGTRSS